MTVKRPYPETWSVVRGRAPRVASLPNGGHVVLSEPGFATQNRVVAHVCQPCAAQEGLGSDGCVLVAPTGGVFACEPDAPLAAGIWSDPYGRFWLAWSDGAGVHVRRTRQALTERGARDLTGVWLTLAGIDGGGQWHLGSGVLEPGDAGLLLVAALERPAGRLLLCEARTDGSACAQVHAHPLDHSPSVALDPDGQTIHVVWDTDDLRILYRRVSLDALRSGRVPQEEPTQVWTGCHDPSVGTNGRQVVVAYTGHMQHIKYGWFDGHQWHLDLHLTTLHARFQGTLEHSPWFWTDGDGVLHLSFACLTRAFLYDSRWLGHGFSDPQPVEGLMHPSLFGDYGRVRAERMSVALNGGATLLSSSFLPEQHGLYTRAREPVVLRPDEALLWLDMDEVAQLANFTPAVEPLRKDPAEPILEPTDRDEDFDGQAVLNGGTVLADGGRYRMWYGAIPIHTETSVNWYDQVFVGYAESDDGVVWRRVPTGLAAEFRGRPAPHRVENVPRTAAIFIDPTDTPSRRYKGIIFETRAHRLDHVKATGEPGYLGLPRRGWLSTSPDGLAWQMEDVVVDFPGPEPYGFTPQHAICDPHDPNPDRRFKVIGYSSLIGRIRAATMATSADCLHWTVAERSPLLDPMAAVTPVRQSKIHDASLCRYGRYLLALYGYQFPRDGSADVRLAVLRARDRFHFVLPEMPWLAQGEPGTWNSGYMMPASLVVGDETLEFFYGCNPLPGPEKHLGIPPWRVCAGRAVCRRDRFVRLSPTEAGRPATLVTVPLHIQHDQPLQLSVNAKLAPSSRLRVALVEPDNAEQERPGYEAQACRPLSGDSLDHPVRWLQRRELPSGGRPLSVKLVLDGTPDDALYGLTLRRLT